MPTIPQRIAGAFAVLFGRYGDVARMARDREPSRQSLYREAERVIDAVDGTAAGARRAEPERQVVQLRAQVHDLRGRLERSVEGRVPYPARRLLRPARDVGGGRPGPRAGGGGAATIRQRSRRGQRNSGHGAPPRRCWSHAERAFARAEAAEAAWHQVRTALELFTPDGRLNDRGRAEAIASAAIPHLTGPSWAEVRRLSGRPESFTFLDQAARRLMALGLEPDVLAAPLEPEGLRRRPWRQEGATPVAAARGLALARTVRLEKADPGWRDHATRVVEVLRGVWRASGLVECVDSAARMQQSRHRKVPQGLLDLKRLYWNLRRFRTGHRKGHRPYSLPGLKVPELSFWEFLKLTPEQLREQLSAAEHAP